MEALSPLRYPGGKRALLPAIEAHVRERPTTLFIEPFCGGASASLHLLASGAVSRAIIADADPLVSAFWRVATLRPAELIEAISKEPVTLERWDHWRAAEPEDTLSRGTKALFLNRTSFSGILHCGAGPLGGRAQAGNVKISSRWYPATVARRIEVIGQLAADGRLEAWAGDWRETLRRVGGTGPDVLVYFDPPYVDKGSRLYAQAFDEQDHRELAAFLTSSQAPARWLLSYDDDPLVRQLYDAQVIEEHELAYSAAAGRKAVTDKAELLISPRESYNIVPCVSNELPEALLVLARTAADPDALARQLEADAELQRQVWASRLGIQASEVAVERRPDNAPELALGLVARAAFEVVGRPVPDLDLEVPGPKPAASRFPRVDKRKSHGPGWRTSKRKVRKQPMSEWDREQAAEAGPAVVARVLDDFGERVGWSIPVVARERLLRVTATILETTIQRIQESAHDPLPRSEKVTPDVHFAVRRADPNLDDRQVQAVVRLLLGTAPRGGGRTPSLVSAWVAGWEMEPEEWRRAARTWLSDLLALSATPLSSRARRRIFEPLRASAAQLSELELA